VSLADQLADNAEASLGTEILDLLRLSHDPLVIVQVTGKQLQNLNDDLYLLFPGRDGVIEHDEDVLEELDQVLDDALLPAGSLVALSLLPADGHHLAHEPKCKDEKLWMLEGVSS
jgi:hypothetical protein